MLNSRVSFSSYTLCGLIGLAVSCPLNEITCKPLSISHVGYLENTQFISSYSILNLILHAYLETSPWFLVNIPFCLCFSHRDFLGTKEASLLLMAMFLLAVFYHGQQVMPCFSPATRGQLAFPFAIKATLLDFSAPCSKDSYES